VITRRRFSRHSLTAVGALSLAACAAAPRPAAPSSGAFRHGVASGDPLADRVVLWTRISTEADPVPVRWWIAADEGFQRIVNAGEVSALAVRDHTVKVDVVGLEPGRTYHYRFAALGEESPVGRTRTTPVATVSRVRFAVASCANHPFGYFNAYARIAARPDLDAVLHLGDYYYEYAPGTYGDGDEFDRVPSPAKEVVTLDEYRQRHAQYKSDPDLQEAHRVHPWITVWDDHETADNSFRDGAGNHDPENGEGAWADRKAAAVRAYHEWMPIREQSAVGGRIYRSFRFGDLVDLLMLDTRLHGRTAILADRNDTVGLADPTRTILGPDQQAWLAEELRASQRRRTAWRVLGQQCMFGQLVDDERLILNADQWDGYPFSRDAVLDQLAAESIRDNVVLTGDIHSSWALDIARDPFTPEYNADTGRGSLAVEMVTPAVSSPSPFIGEEDVLERERRTMERPHIHWVEFRSRGYVVVDVTPERAQGEWWLLDGVDQRGAAERLAATLATERGRNHLVKG